MALQALLARGAGKQLPAVLDFDNTLVCGDIGEAALAVLARDGKLTPRNISRDLCPPFRLPRRGWVRMIDCADITQYYEALLQSTNHCRKDPAPLAQAYSWAAEVLTGLTVLDVLKATCAASESGRQPGGASESLGKGGNRGPKTKMGRGEGRVTRPGWIQVTVGKTAYEAPFFYPEMVHFVAELLRLKFDVWVVSASNVWSVRWMVLNGLNPLLREAGVKQGVRPEQVIGVSCLLQDAKGILHKDSVLVRENKRYAALEEGFLGGLRLTRHLELPRPIYSGKVAAIWDVLRRAPFLAVGDSPGDHPMLAWSENRLWLARLEKAGYLRATLRLARMCRRGRWLFQCVRTQSDPGFVPDAAPSMNSCETKSMLVSL